MNRWKPLAAGASALAVAVATFAAGGAASAANGGSAMVAPTVPSSPSVGTYRGELRGQTRTFRLTAVEFEQQIATFPIQHAKVLGWKVTGQPDSTASTPGPTLVSYAGEKVQFVVTNALSMPTSLHPHGTHEPNVDDGVAGIDFQPIQPGQTRAYAPYTPGHAGTFAYHTHTSTAEQEPRGLVGLFVVLPRKVKQSTNPALDLGMTLQQFDPDAENPAGQPPGDGKLDADDEAAPARPAPDERGMFPFSTINGRTGDASNLGPDAEGGVIKVKQGSLVQIRLYNASSMTHSMHLHGMDMTLVDINGHAVTPRTVTTQAISPGEFFTLQFRASNPGTWIFHCSFPGHVGNNGMSGQDGAPVGMLRIFQVGSGPAVPPGYFGPPSA